MSVTTDISDSTEIDNLRIQILKKFELMGNVDDGTFPIRQHLLCSEAYRKVDEYIQKKESFPESSDIWSMILEEVEKDSPDFRFRLTTLAKGKVSNSDFQIALLIRCGISPTNMALLLNRTKSAVSTRRASLNKKIFGPGANIKLLDLIIRYL